MTKLGERYELIRRVGAGGMAEVWLAHDEELAGRPVAIKIMHQHMLPNTDDVERFQREMRFAAMMDHPNIVTVYTTGTYHGAPFLVMEYLRGHDLERQLPGWDAEHIAGIGRDICSGLAYAHSAGVIHRDIKPGNLFLCESGQVKITDFGVARAVGETALSSAVLVGTFAFMPPERWRGEPSAFSSDIWAVGCVLYRLIAGRLPRQLPDVADYAAAATRGEPVPDLRDVTNVPGWLAEPVMAMLADDPARRPSADDCAKALTTAQSSAPFPVLSVGNWRIHGRSGRSGQSGQSGGFGPDELVTGLADVVPSQDPVTTPVVRPAGPRAAARRARRLNRASAAVGGLALLLFAGSITAWRLSTPPPVPGLAGSAKSPAASHAAAAIPAGSPPASRSAAAAPGPASSADPAPSGSGSATGSLSASPTGSGSASPTASPDPTATTPAPSTPDSPSDSPPASDTPSLVPVPNVIGMNFPQALRALQGAGFTVASTHTPPGNTVVSESPSGEAPAGSTITVVYGTGQ